MRCGLANACAAFSAASAAAVGVAAGVSALAPGNRISPSRTAARFGGWSGSRRFHPSNWKVRSYLLRLNSLEDETLNITRRCCPKQIEDIGPREAVPLSVWRDRSECLVHRRGALLGPARYLISIPSDPFTTGKLAPTDSGGPHPVSPFRPLAQHTSRPWSDRAASSSPGRQDRTERCDDRADEPFRSEMNPSAQNRVQM